MLPECYLFLCVLLRPLRCPFGLSFCAHHHKFSPLSLSLSLSLLKLVRVLTAHGVRLGYGTVLEREITFRQLGAVGIALYGTRKSIGTDSLNEVIDMGLTLQPKFSSINLAFVLLRASTAPTVGQAVCQSEIPKRFAMSGVSMGRVSKSWKGGIGILFHWK
jgi:hypothetical protein